MFRYLVALLCVLVLVVGQILFKASAIGLKESGTLFSVKPALTLMAAMCLYGVTSIAWVWVLQKVELGRVYPLMALAFFLVPLASHLVFGEKFSSQYFTGVSLIAVGIIVAVKA